jgi:hypothetical protein
MSSPRQTRALCSFFGIAFVKLADESLLGTYRKTLHETLHKRSPSMSTFLLWQLRFVGPNVDGCGLFKSSHSRETRSQFAHGGYVVSTCVG